MEGVLVIDKPPGPTSHDVVARIRRSTGLKRVGHTGTLDPLASGVLPLVLGRATRLVRFLIGGEKEYDAQIRLGLETDTYDITGRRSDPARLGLEEPVRSARSVTRMEIERVLADFRGSYLQHPPQFSAKRVQGVRAYALARSGRAVQPAPSQVTVERLELLDFRDDILGLRLTCSSGFYVRSLAHDVGVRLATGACLQALRRRRCGNFNLEDAVPLDAAERHPERVQTSLFPLSSLLPDMPAVVMTHDGVRRASRGNLLSRQHFSCGTPPGASWVRLFDQEGHLIAVAEPTAEPGILHPHVVVV